MHSATLTVRLGLEPNSRRPQNVNRTKGDNAETSKQTISTRCILFIFSPLDFGCEIIIVSLPVCVQGIRPFRCDVCFKTYRSRNNLLSHKQVHEGDRPFKCPMCVYAGRELDHLLVHLGTDHLNDYTYFCSLCRKPFGRSFNLQVYIRSAYLKFSFLHININKNVKRCLVLFFLLVGKSILLLDEK